ncbi:MAG TPA: NADPH-dependent F420 reductase [Ktedonobacterales bacterium]|nr:NADPH-dependent F420 reductase [Ktedonobacterales bacterium]
MSAGVISILGAGRVGTAIARQALRAGYTVYIAASGDPEDVSLIVDITAPGAIATSAAEAIARGDIIILSIPLRKYRTLDPDTLAGKVVIDAMNYWVEADGHMPIMEASDRSTSEVVQGFLPGARLVKTLNHIGYHDLETDGAPAGTAGRRALAVAGNDPAARAEAMALIDRLGYDAVDAGPLAMGGAFEPGTPIFNGKLDRNGIQALLAEAQRAPQLTEG